MNAVYAERQCLCGCGTPLKPKTRYYVQGHDSKHLWMLVHRGDVTAVDELPTLKLRARFIYELTGMTSSMMGGFT